MAISALGGQGNKEAPQLAFAIPTYRRALELDNLLRSLVPQAAKENLPIYISDNGSPPETEAVVRRYRDLYQGIYFERHETNRGFEANVVKALSMAKDARYTWLLSDDDLVLDGAVRSLLGLMEQDNGEMALYVLNWERRDAALTLVLLERFMDVDADAIVDHRRLFVEYGLSVLRFMSVLVYRNDLLGPALDKHASDSLKGVKNWGFVYQQLALEIAAGQRSKVVSEPHLAQRIGRPFYEGRDCEVFLLDFPRMLLSLPACHYSAGDKRAVLRRGARFEPKFLPTILTALARSRIDRRSLMQMVDTYTRLGMLDRASISAALLASPHSVLRVARSVWRAPYVRGNSPNP